MITIIFISKSRKMNETQSFAIWFVIVFSGFCFVFIFFARQIRTLLIRLRMFSRTFSYSSSFWFKYQFSNLNLWLSALTLGGRILSNHIPDLNYISDLNFLCLLNTIEIVFNSQINLRCGLRKDWEHLIEVRTKSIKCILKSKPINSKKSIYNKIDLLRSWNEAEAKETTLSTLRFDFQNPNSFWP